MTVFMCLLMVESLELNFIFPSLALRRLEQYQPSLVISS